MPTQKVCKHIKHLKLLSDKYLKKKCLKFKLKIKLFVIKYGIYTWFEHYWMRFFFHELMNWYYYGCKHHIYSTNMHILYISQIFYSLDWHNELTQHHIFYHCLLDKMQPLSLKTVYINYINRNRWCDVKIDRLVFNKE